VKLKDSRLLTVVLIQVTPYNVVTFDGKLRKLTGYFTF